MSKFHLQKKKKETKRKPLQEMGVRGELDILGPGAGDQKGERGGTNLSVSVLLFAD